MESLNQVISKIGASFDGIDLEGISRLFKEKVVLGKHLPIRRHFKSYDETSEKAQATGVLWRISILNRQIIRYRSVADYHRKESSKMSIPL